MLCICFVDGSDNYANRHLNAWPTILRVIKLGWRSTVAVLERRLQLLRKMKISGHCPQEIFKI